MKLFSGTIGDRKTTVDVDYVRDERVRFARANEAWTEITNEFVVRGPSGCYLVHAPSDRVFRAYPGAVFGRGAARPHYIAPDAKMTFYVDQDGDVRFLEHPAGMPATWSEVVEQRERHKRRT